MSLSFGVILLEFKFKQQTESNSKPNAVGFILLFSLAITKKTIVNGCMGFCLSVYVQTIEKKMEETKTSAFI